MTDIITEQDDILFCNAKWEEANGLLSDSWAAYMELGKELRELKEGKYKGRFKQWVNDNLKFTYEWARILMNGYTRYELSGFNDKPAASIKEYAKDNSGCPEPDEPETEQSMPKQKETKENTVRVMSKIEVWCEQQGLDEMQTMIAKSWYTLSKKLAKIGGKHAIDEAIQLISECPELYKEV